MKTSVPRYDGSVIVERSILLDMPVIYASINYRVSGKLMLRLDPRECR